MPPKKNTNKSNKKSTPATAQDPATVRNPLTAASVMFVDSISLYYGPTWKPATPQENITRLIFCAWTDNGQIVQGLPNGSYYYLPNGIPLLYPLNVNANTVLPIMRSPYTMAMTLMCPHDLELRIGGPPNLTWENYYPQDPVVRIIGGALDIDLFGGFLDPDGKEASKTKTPRPTRPVNAFIAYRSLYAQYIPLGKQMDVSGIIRRMWQCEPATVKRKFSVAGQVYSAERDVLKANGLPKVTLTIFLKANLERFGLDSPNKDIIAKFMTYPDLKVASDLKNFILDEYVLGITGNRARIDYEHLDQLDPSILETFCTAIEEREEAAGVNTIEDIFGRYFAENPNVYGQLAGQDFQMQAPMVF